MKQKQTERMNKVNEFLNEISLFKEVYVDVNFQVDDKGKLEVNVKGEVMFVGYNKNQLLYRQFKTGTGHWLLASLALYILNGHTLPHNFFDPFFLNGVRYEALQNFEAPEMDKLKESALRLGIILD